MTEDKRAARRVARFWARVNKTETCWLWTGNPTSRYGTTQDETGESIGAHVYSYRAHVGPTNGLYVLHKCDNPRCVRPDHLFLGTQAENLRDCVKKRRHRAAKIGPDETDAVRWLRSLGSFTLAQIGRWFGVSGARVWKICCGSPTAE